MAREATIGGAWPVDKTVDTGSTLTDKLNDLRNASYSLHAHASGSAVRPSYLDSLNAALWVDNATAASWNLNLYDGAQDITLFTINTTSNTVSLPAGVITTPFALTTGTPAVGAAPTGFTDLSIRSDAAAGISILSDNNDTVGLNLGSTADTTGAKFTWLQSPSNICQLGTTTSSGELQLLSGNGTARMYFKSDGRVGLGTSSPETSSMFHVYSGISGGTATSTAREIIIESNDHCGMSIITTDTKYPRIFLGTGSAPLGLQLWFDHVTSTNGIAYVGSNSGTSDTSLTYKAGTSGVYLDGANDYIGLLNASPECRLHTGVALSADVVGVSGYEDWYIFNNVGGGVLTNTLAITGSGELSLTYHYLHATANERFMRMHFLESGGDRFFRVAAFNDSYAERWYAWSVKLDDGTLYLGQNDVVIGGSNLNLVQFVGGGDQDLRVDNNGDVYTV